MSEEPVLDQKTNEQIKPKCVLCQKELEFNTVEHKCVVRKMDKDYILVISRK